MMKSRSIARLSALHAIQYSMFKPTVSDTTKLLDSLVERLGNKTVLMVLDKISVQSGSEPSASMNLVSSQASKSQNLLH